MNEPNSLFEIALSQFDTLRENILKSGKTQYTLTASTNDLTLATLDRDKETGILYAATAGNGLLLKTYQSDKFNNWVSTEWIDGENGISAVTAISTTGEYENNEQRYHSIKRKNHSID